MYELAIDNLLVGCFPGLAEAKREAAHLAAVPLQFDVSFVGGTRREWSAVCDGRHYRITLAQGELMD